MEGQWVEVNALTDTLTFRPFGGEKSLILGRGNEIRDGYSLPKYGSGPYEYKLLSGDKISLRWAFSSTRSFSEYHFKKDGDKLTIEEFYDSTTSGLMLTFKKLN